MTLHITINGELGSGKTVIARRLAEARGLEFVSTGELQRSIAESLGLSTLETNLRAENDEEIDAKVDGFTMDLAYSQTPRVFDSRMAFHFVPHSFKVYLLVDASVAAERLFSARSSKVEGYDTPHGALLAAGERYQSERRRFIAKYGVDVSRLRNYDLVVDTTEAKAEEVFDAVQEALDSPTASRPMLLLSPRCVLPTDGIYVLRGFEDYDDVDGSHAVEVGYSRPFLFVVDGHRALSAALRRGAPLVKGDLVAEADEEVVGGISANAYLAGEARRGWVYDWEHAHGFRFLTYPEFLRT